MSFVSASSVILTGPPLINMGRAKTPDAVIEFFEGMLVVPEGSRLGKTMVLEDEQKHWISEVYLRDKQGDRIVQDVLLTMARKNGKTAFLAGLCLCHLCGPENYPNSQLYSIGFDRGQAEVLLELMAKMVYMEPALDDRLKVVTTKKMIRDPVTNTTYRALSSEARSHHGKSCPFLVTDEAGQFGARPAPTVTMYDTMITSRGAYEKEALSWVISTQAADPNSLMGELVDYARKVDSGVLIDPSTKAFVYDVPLTAKDAEERGIDVVLDEDGEVDIWAEKNWYLANPFLGQFRSLTDMRDLAKKAQEMPSRVPVFRNLYLNQAVETAEIFVDYGTWKKNGAEAPVESLLGKRCWAGIDLSSKNDLSALVLVFPDDPNADEPTFDVLCWAWKPEENIVAQAKADKVPYDVWVTQDFLIAVPGRVIDYAYIASQIAELMDLYDWQMAGFDRWRINDLVRELEKQGVNAAIMRPGEEDPEQCDLAMVNIGQGFKDMQPCVEVMEDCLAGERIRHGMHPILTWCVSNTRVARDPAGNRKFDKLKSTGRIDLTVAMAMALRAYDMDEESGPSVYESDGLLVM